MLTIKYQPFSLLYGQSLFWIMYSVLAPLHMLPDLAGSKCRYAIEQLPKSEKVVSVVTLFRNNSLYRSMMNAMFIVTQTIYVLIYLIRNFLLISKSLAAFGSQYSESLTYKVLYNTPILSNGGLFIITLMNMLDSESYLWKIYDDFSTLSVDYNYQARVMKLCVLITIPEVLINLIESHLNMRVIFASSYYHHYMNKNSDPYLHIFWYFFMYSWVLPVGVVNIMIRYKPLMTLLYSSTCVSKHLTLINSQLVIERHGRTSTTRSPPIGTNSDKVERSPNLEMFQQRYNDRLKRFDIYNSRASLPIIEGQSSVSGRMSISVPPPASKPQDPSKATTASTTEQVNNERLFEISNLYELERHLTQVSHFIYDIDRVSPESVMATTAINFMTYFFLAFNLAFERTWSGSLIYICICFARTFPISMMLISGSWVEKECKRLVNKLESMYLQNQSQSLIYKQMASSYLSLARILKILENIRLNCNGLMKVNSGTLRKCFIYIITIILIVVQYDALMYINVK